MRVLMVALLVVALMTSCGDDDADVGGGDTTAAPAPTTSSTSTPTTEVTTSTQPGPALGSPLVNAGPSGVQRISRDATSTGIVTDPAAIAFGIGSDLVVFQDAEPSGPAFPWPGTGQVRVWTGGEVRTLATDPDARRIALLDAAMIDGAPLVLVKERFGEVGPDDTFETLVQIDLRDDTRTTIVRRPAWESGHYAARFLPNGDVVGLFSSEAHILLARWTATSDEPVWTQEVGIDVIVDIALRDGEITLIQSSSDPEAGFTPVLTVSARDEATGHERSSESIRIDDPESGIESGVVCRGWATPTALVCGGGRGVPIIVSVEDGSVDRLPGESGSIPTVVRPT